MELEMTFLLITIERGSFCTTFIFALKVANTKIKIHNHIIRLGIDLRIIPKSQIKNIQYSSTIISVKSANISIEEKFPLS